MLTFLIVLFVIGLIIFLLFRGLKKFAIPLAVIVGGYWVITHLLPGLIR